jgi:hypothetical protein
MAGDDAITMRTTDGDRAGREIRTGFTELAEALRSSYARMCEELGIPRQAPGEPHADNPGAAAGPWNDWKPNGPLTPLLEADIGALQDAWLGVEWDVVEGAKNTPRWESLSELWSQMRDLAAKTNQGILRFENDADALGPFHALWLRGCEVISHGSRTLMDQLEGEGKKDSIGWHGMRLLHHAAEQTIAHMRGLLPAEETAPMGTYDRATTIAVGRASADRPEVPPQAAAEHARSTAVVAAGFPGFLAQRMQRAATGSVQTPGSAAPGRGPAPAAPGNSQEAGR